jgi:hypothetical protein
MVILASFALLQSAHTVYYDFISYNEVIPCSLRQEFNLTLTLTSLLGIKDILHKFSMCTVHISILGTKMASIHHVDASNALVLYNSDIQIAEILFEVIKIDTLEIKASCTSIQNSICLLAPKLTLLTLERHTSDIYDLLILSATACPCNVIIIEDEDINIRRVECLFSILYMTRYIKSFSVHCSVQTPSSLLCDMLRSTLTVYSSLQQLCFYSHSISNEHLQTHRLIKRFDEVLKKQKIVLVMLQKRKCILSRDLLYLLFKTL